MERGRNRTDVADDNVENVESFPCGLVPNIAADKTVIGIRFELHKTAAQALIIQWAVFATLHVAHVTPVMGRTKVHLSHLYVACDEIVHCAFTA